MTDRRSTLSTSGLATRGLVLTGAAILLNILLWAIALPVLDIDVRIPESPMAEQLEELGVWSVIGVSAISGLAAVAVAVLLQRKAGRPRAIFLAVTGVVLLLSFLPIFPLDISVGGQFVLALMHVVVYAVVVPRLALHLPERAAGA